MMDIHVDQTLKSTTLGSFADYTKIWQVINANYRTNTLQQKLQYLYNWADNNNIHYNFDKFELMRYCKTEDESIKPGA